MASPLVSCGLKALDFTRRITLGLINDIPPDKLWYQPVSAGNHVLWIAGHLATADDFYLRGLGNRETGFPPEWRGLFGMGSTPQADASSYPALSDVKEQLSRMRVGLVPVRSTSQRRLATLTRSRLVLPIARSRFLSP